MDDTQTELGGAGHNQSGDKDFFHGMFSNNPYKTGALIFSILTTLALPIGFYMIIWYEQYGSDNKRTAINKMVSYLFKHVWPCSQIRFV